MTRDRLRQEADRPDLSNEDHAYVYRELVEEYKQSAKNGIAALSKAIGEWRRRKRFETRWNQVPAKLMLTVTELSEAMEAFRHLEMTSDSITASPLDETDCNPWYSNFCEEIADTLIRLLDLDDSLHLNLEQRVCEKMAKNEFRPIKHGKTC